MADERAFVVIAEFEVQPDKVEAFMAAGQKHAANCLANEPGCRRFDMIVRRDDPTRIAFYEIYDDAAAFAHHGTTPHLAWFREQIGGMIVSREIKQLDLVGPAAVPAPAGPGKVLVAVPPLGSRRHLLEPLLAAGYELTFNDVGRTFDEEELLARLPGHVGVVAGIEPYTARVLAASPGLKVIARLGVGFDQIDLAAASRHGVAIAMAFGTNHEPVADHAFAMMAALAHGLKDYDKKVRDGGWGSVFHGRLHNATVGIVGFGRIGRTMAKRCQGFAMEVLVADPFVDADTVARTGCRLTSLEDLLQSSDYVSIHAPLNESTRHLISAPQLAMMKSSAILINTARGPLVDEAALVEALEAGTIGGAGLDVFEIEPLPTSPLRGLDNVLLTPHVAGVSEWAVGSMATRAIQSIIEINRGIDPGGGLVLNPEALQAS